MANLKEIRTRISSVASTRQITSAMKMVSAAKLKKAQDTVTHFRPYIQKMDEIMEHVVSTVGNDQNNVYAEDRDYKKVLIVVVTSNRGLCGAFNSNVIKEAMQLAEQKYGRFVPQDKIRFLNIGKKGYETMRKRKAGIDKAPPNIDIVDDLTYEKAAEVAEALMKDFVERRYDCIDIVYNEFVNAATQKVVCKQFLPMLNENKIKADKNKKQDAATQTNFLFEPTREYILRELIPQDLRLSFYGVMLDSKASEFGARMTSMHQATDNATTLIQELTLQYNKARQASITNEILEIVGGAEALKG